MRYLLAAAILSLSTAAWAQDAGAPPTPDAGLAPPAVADAGSLAPPTPMDAGVAPEPAQDAGGALPVVAPTTSASGVTFSSGPSIPLISIRLADPATGKTATSLLGAGAGYQLGWGFVPMMLGSKQYQMLNLDLDAFGQVGQDGGQTLDSASVAGAVCTLSSLVCLGFGVDLIQYYGGAPSGDQLTGVMVGKVSKSNLFSLLSVNFNFALGAEGLPKTELKYGEPPPSPPPGNTLHLGW